MVRVVSTARWQPRPALALASCWRCLMAWVWTGPTSDQRGPETSCGLVDDEERDAVVAADIGLLARQADDPRAVLQFELGDGVGRGRDRPAEAVVEVEHL